MSTFTTPYTYSAKVLEVRDGDTIKASVRLHRARRFKNADLGLRVFLEDGYICTHVGLRLLGLDAPAKNTPAGLASRNYVTSRLPVGSLMVVRTVKDKTEKYGRWLATVWVGQRAVGPTLNEQLLEMGFALPWDGQGPHPTA